MKELFKEHKNTLVMVFILGVMVGGSLAKQVLT